MSVKHPQLGRLLGWKHNYAPGIVTCNGVLNEWPASLGPWPDDAQLQTWCDEWDALPADDPAKDTRAALRKQLQGATTIAQMKQIVEKLI